MCVCICRGTTSRHYRAEDRNDFSLQLSALQRSLKRASANVLNLARPRIYSYIYYEAITKRYIKPKHRNPIKEDYREYGVSSMTEHAARSRLPITVYTTLSLPSPARNEQFDNLTQRQIDNGSSETNLPRSIMSGGRHIDLSPEGTL